jgi:hypothetical protein
MLRSNGVGSNSLAVPSKVGGYAPQTDWYVYQEDKDMASRFFDESPKSFVVDWYRIYLKVVPLLNLMDRSIPVNHGLKHRTVETDNQAYLNRELHFGSSPQPNEKFVWRYATQETTAFVFPTLLRMQRPNDDETIVQKAIPPIQQGAYDSHGLGVYFEFIPEAGRVYRKDVIILNGYAKGSRHAHFHLFRGESVSALFKRISVTLDLGKYAEAKFKLCGGDPQLHFHAKDTGCGDLCKQLDLARLVRPYSVNKPWRWTWELEHCDEGVINVNWDLVEPDDFAGLMNTPHIFQKLVNRDAKTIAALMTFDEVGKHVFQNGGSSEFLSGTMRALLKLSRHTFDIHLQRIEELFTLYYARTQRIQIQAMDREDCVETHQLFRKSKGHGAPTKVCKPLGFDAWHITRNFLRTL